MAASIISCEALWLHKLLVGLFDHELDPMVIYCDNLSCVKLFENLVFHDRSKHIEIRYHFIQDQIQKGVVKLQYISTDQHITDILTKPLAKAFRDKLGLVQKSFFLRGSVENIAWVGNSAQVQCECVRSSLCYFKK